MTMSLKKGDLASTPGPYITGPNGDPVRVIKYLEIVKVIKEINKDGDVYVEGLDSKARFWVKEASLTKIQPEQTGWQQ
jgi:hypothetical protein